MSTIGGPNIIETGLVLALDGANRKSNPGSGTTWTDLSGNGKDDVSTGKRKKHEDVKVEE